MKGGLHHFRSKRNLGNICLGEQSIYTTDRLARQGKRYLPPEFRFEDTMIPTFDNDRLNGLRALLLLE
jgi:hypothetical protein